MGRVLVSQSTSLNETSSNATQSLAGASDTSIATSSQDPAQSMSNSSTSADASVKSHPNAVSNMTASDGTTTSPNGAVSVSAVDTGAGAPSSPLGVKSSSTANPKSSVKPTKATTTKAQVAPTSHSSASFTATRTITDSVESTLSRASFISVIESDGQTSSTAPPFLTILSTSTNSSDGSLITWTHVVANPTPVGLTSNTGSRAGFLSNAGETAGVFLVVGAIVTGALVFLLYMFCRKQRRKREQHRRWLVSMHRPRPLSDSEPFMSERSYERYEAPWDGRVRSSIGDASVGPGHYRIAPPRRVQPNYEMKDPTIFRTSAVLAPAYDVAGPTSGLTDDNIIGLAITTDDDKKPSSEQSSPSIYPASLPPESEVDSSQVTAVEPSVPPPRPRRSHLRSSSMSKTTQLVTPPASDASHSPTSDVVNPFTAESEASAVQHNGVRLNEILGRRTLLDIRPVNRQSVEIQRV